MLFFDFDGGIQGPESWPNRISWSQEKERFLSFLTIAGISKKQALAKTTNQIVLASIVRVIIQW